MADILPGTEQYAGQHRRWNEVHCLSRKEFDRMAPSVVRLELARLDELISTSEPGSPTHDTLITARHRLRLLAADLDDGADRERLTGHLESAILTLGLQENAAHTNIADRLDYVLAQVRRLY